MGSLLQNGKQQWIDGNGFPLVGGSVYFYAPGTENPMTTWLDSALTEPNTNPVVLDARGQAVVWGSGSYRQVVQDRFGVTIWDQITIDTSGLITQLTTNLAAIGGSALVGFEQLGSGAIPRTIQDELREQVKVTQFGAKGDGVTDDLVAFQKALASGAKLVLMPNPVGGFYRLSAGITVPDGVTLRGQSMVPASQVGVPGGTVLKFDASVTPCVTLSNANNTTGNLECCSVWRAGGAPAVNTVGVLFDRAYRPYLTDVCIVNHYILTQFVSRGAAGIEAQLFNCYLSDCNGYYMYFDGWPECRVTGGRMGRIGSGEYAGISFIYATSADPAPSSGAGPNTLCFENLNFNQGGTAGPQHLYMQDAIGALTPIGGVSEIQFVNCHVENITAEYFVATATCKILQRLGITQSYFNTPTPFFNIAANIQINQCRIADSFIAGDVTLATSALINRLSFSNNEIGGIASFTGGAGFQNNMIITGGHIDGILTLAGVWGYLGVVTDASGTSYTAVQSSSGANIYVDTPGCFARQGSGTLQVLDSYNAAGGTTVTYRTARGSSGAPTVSLANDSTQSLQAFCYDGASFGRMGGTRWIQQGAAPSAGSTPGGWVIGTTPVGANSPTDRFTVDPVGNFYPVVDNAYSAGVTGKRLSSVWAVNGTIQTSDERDKTDIEDTTLGLDFVNALRPVSFKWKSGGTEIVRQVWLDSEGKELAEGAEIPDDATPGPIITNDIPGARTHMGFIAQEVKAAMDTAGVEFGAWVLTDKNDPNSQQAMRPDQLIPILTKAIQQLTARVAELESKG